MSKYNPGDEVLLKCKVKEILPYGTVKVEIKSDHANYYNIFVEEGYIEGKASEKPHGADFSYVHNDGEEKDNG